MLAGLLRPTTGLEPTDTPWPSYILGGWSCLRIQLELRRWAVPSRCLAGHLPMGCLARQVPRRLRLRLQSVRVRGVLLRLLLRLRLRLLLRLRPRLVLRLRLRLRLRLLQTYAKCS